GIRKDSSTPTTGAEEPERAYGARASEIKLQSKLKLTRTVYHCRDYSEVGIGKGLIGDPKLQGIKGVKCLKSKLQSLGFGDGKLAKDRKVEIPAPICPIYVSA